MDGNKVIDDSYADDADFTVEDGRNEDFYCAICDISCTGPQVRYVFFSREYSALFSIHFSPIRPTWLVTNTDGRRRRRTIVAMEA